MGYSQNEAAYRWVLHNTGRAHRGTNKFVKASGRYDRCAWDGRHYISYTTTVGAFRDGPEGKHVMLWDYKSISTQRHLGFAQRSASRAGLKVYWVESLHLAPDENLQKYLRDVEEFGHRAKRGWKAAWGYTSEAHWEAHIWSLYGVVEAYQRSSGADIKLLGTINMEQLVAEIQLFRNNKVAAWNDPKAVAKRFRAKALAAAKRLLVQQEQDDEA